MRVFITGGSGFVGQNLIQVLRAEGHEVMALARSQASARIVAWLGGFPVWGDLLDSAAVERRMDGCEVVFHCAGRMAFWGGQEELFRVNVEGTRTLLDAAKKVGVNAFVYVSAAAVVADGRPLRKVEESDQAPKIPFGAYARTKAEAEKMVLQAGTPSLRTVAVRPPLIWGRGDRTFLPGIVRAVKEKKFIWVDGGEYPYSTCHVRNVCEGALLAAKRGTGGRAYFLTDGPPGSFRQFITDLLLPQDLSVNTVSIPRWAAWWGAAITEKWWRLRRLSGTPPITRDLLALIGGPMELNDARARLELGYQGSFIRKQGMAELLCQRGLESGLSNSEA
jgi:nucleoside-diphosphate-sugar epimerase